MIKRWFEPAGGGRSGSFRETILGTIRWALLFGVALGALTVIAGESPSSPGAVTEPPSHLFQWRPFLAPFHAVVLHFPIGFVVMAAILELYRLWRPSDELKRVTVMVLWLSLATGIVAALFGTMRAGSGGYEHKMLELHRVYGMAVPFLTLLTLAVQKLAFRAGTRRSLTLAYRSLLGLTTALLLVAGHYGGNLTHGSHYLTENAPTFMRDWLEEELDAPPAATSLGTNLSPGLQLFVDKVKPVLDSKCVRCHGPEKQKGDYRLDQAEAAVKGGESGRTAIKPGEPLESHLVRLILLPRDDDNAMPPDGKEPLTPEETMALIHWIQQGAPFPGHEEKSVEAGTNHAAGAAAASASAPAPAP